MNASRCFVDTNVIVYAHDVTAGEKRKQADTLLRQLWESGDGCVSVQVLQEFFVNATRKVSTPLDVKSASEVVADLSHWHVHAPGPDDVLGAIDIHRKESISFWDALIIKSATSLGCRILYSEDLNPGQRYNGVQVQNPFVTD